MQTAVIKRLVGSDQGIIHTRTSGWGIGCVGVGVEDLCGMGKCRQVGAIAVRVGWSLELQV